jgi:DtxR family Mn-dependent transcriptional regulator
MEFLVMHPFLNLLVAVLVVVGTALLLRAPHGWWRRWLRRLPERVLTEDALKHLYSCQEGNSPGSIDSIAGALEVRRDTAARLTYRLEKRGLILAEPQGIRLSDEGRQYALQVIRTHRLWEQYLAERTGVHESEWHALADRVEHELTPDQVDALAQHMGDPVFDPHGDPIPSASGMVRRPAGQLLSTVDAGTMVRIVHIEDEPESSYRILRDAQLQSGMIVTVTDSTPLGIEVDTGAGRCQLGPIVAANVTVQRLDAALAGRVSLRRLSSLAQGETALVTDISPGCRGVERHRLLDLGLVPGTIVKAEFASPSGDPVAYKVRGALIALRAQQAEMIHIADRVD